LQLLLAGATRNQVGVVIGSLIGLMFYIGEMRGDAQTSRDALNLLERWTQTDFPAWLMGLIVLALIMLAGWIVSIARSVITYHGFTLDRQAGQLRRRFGLLTRQENLFPTHRVQLLEIISPILQRKLGLCRVVARTAGSFAEKEDAGTSELCPIIHRAKADDVVSLVLPGHDPATSLQHVSPLHIRRETVAGTFLLLIPIGIASAVYSWQFAWLAMIAPAIALWQATLAYRALRWGVGERTFIVRQGVLRRTMTLIPRDKLQTATVTRSPFQRRLGLATLRLSVAGGAFGADAAVPDLPHVTALQLLDNITSPPEPSESVAGQAHSTRDNATPAQDPAHGSDGE
jgi:putative membrane protein